MSNKKVKDLILALSICILIYGMFLFFSGYYALYITFELIIVYSCLAIISSFCIYYFYRRSRRTEIEEPSARKINVLNVLLGFLLIFITLTFNLVVGDDLGSYDICLILCGIGIVVLNIDVLKFLNLDLFFINFASRFLFLFMLLYGALFSGVRHLAGNLTENYMLTALTLLSGIVTCFFLNFVGPTTIQIISDPWSHGILLTYNSYRVGIYSPCSGAESMVVFISAIIAYTLSERNIKVKKIALYAVIGLISLFFINILRLILLVLIGYNFGADAMRFFHYNLGWIFFVVGMAVFWFLVMQNKEG